MKFEKEMFEVMETYKKCVEDLFIFTMNTFCNCESCVKEENIITKCDRFYLNLGHITKLIVNEIYEKYADHLEGIKK